MMFVFGSRTKWFVTVLAVAAMATGSITAQAQSKRQRRETNVNRQARINRTIKDTYTHRYEVAGGGGYLRFRSGEYLKRNNEVTWATSGSYFLNPKLGITADVRGSYGNANIPNAFALNGQFRPLINEYMFSGGPTYRLRMREKYAISAVVTGGLAIGNFSGGNKGVASETVGMWKSTNRPVITAGVNFDYNFYPNLAFRFTPTFVGTTFVGTSAIGPLATGGHDVGTFQTNIGFNMGVVYRFGRIK
ncbi:hypothetical protein [Granulicella aggregans]|uniref:hypothetical protein n=1 Tax=Granulicella aggregans TaxID=474949 RepID=UPI0021E0985A|nr:hypothetical protein [Granulicella aggregans]